jgi:deoxyadenosine/deoxycytidine kinase
MWLAIEGVVGAGKTTTASQVGRLAGVETALERLDEHPFLEAYYRDPKRHVVETELAFMLIQIRQLGESFSGDRLVTDFAPAKNLIFARLESDDDDFGLLEQVEARLWRDLPKPDLTVVLDAPLEVCRERMVSRGRPFEQGLNVDDLAQIRNGYLDRLDTLGAVVSRIELTGAETPQEVAETVLQAASLPRRRSPAAPE